MWDKWRVVMLVEITAASETQQVRLLFAVSCCRFKLPHRLEFVTDRLIFRDWLNYLSYAVHISPPFLYFYRSFFSPHFSFYFFQLISFSDFTFLTFLLVPFLSLIVYFHTLFPNTVLSPVCSVYSLFLFSYSKLLTWYITFKTIQVLYFSYHFLKRNC